MTENSPHAIIISSSRSSANFAVAQSIVKALNNKCVVHHVYFTEKKIESVHGEVYNSYPVLNVRAQKNKQFADRLRSQFLKKLYLSIYYNFTNIYDNVFCTKIVSDGLLIVNKIIRDYHVSLIVATNNPIYAHKILYKLQLKSDIECIPLWLDPYLSRYNSYNFIWKYSASLLERRLFENFPKVFSLPETFKLDDTILAFKDKHVTFEVPFIKDLDVKTLTKDVIFAGSIVPGLRELDIPLSIISKVIPFVDPGIRFVFFINNPQNFRDIGENSGGRIVFNSFIPREDLEQRLAQCYMLINIGNINSVQMPSKVVEYISFRKPIIIFQFDKEDPSSRYLNYYWDLCRISAYDNESVSVEKLIEFICGEHKPINYEDLMTVPLYKKSTAQYVANLIRE